MTTSALDKDSSSKENKIFILALSRESDSVESSLFKDQFKIERLFMSVTILR